MKNAILFLSLFIFLSCSSKPEENKPTEDQPFELAARSYCEKAEASLKAWADGDLKKWETYYAKEIVTFSPDGPKGLPFNVDTISTKEQSQWYRDWFKFREVTDVNFSSLSSVAIKATEENPFYGNSGVSVLIYTNMEISYYGSPLIAGTSFIFHFNEEGLIDKEYFIQDLHKQYAAISY